MNRIGTVANFDMVKKMNLEYVLKTILLHHPTSRAKVASLTGLNKMTVSSCVDYFLEKEVILELGTTGTSRGRPPTLIDINPNAGLCIGVDIEVNQFTVLVTDLTGNQLECATYPLTNKDPSYFINELSLIINTLSAAYSSRKLGIVGISIGLQIYYNKQTNALGFSANLQSWIGFPIRTELERIAPNIPLFINPASNAGAVGEIRFGKSKDIHHLVYVSGSWGLSVGIYNEGELYNGASGTAGRLGHSTIHMNGKKCICGNKGCWEMYASVKALYELLDTKPEETPFQNIVESLKDNNPRVLSSIHELGHYYGMGLVNVINAYNPDTICIGGYLSFLGEPFLNSIRNTLKEMMPARFIQDVEIYCSDLGDLGVSYGAVSIVLNTLPQIFVSDGFFG